MATWAWIPEFLILYKKRTGIINIAVGLERGLGLFTVLGGDSFAEICSLLSKGFIGSFRKQCCD